MVCLWSFPVQISAGKVGLSFLKSEIVGEETTSFFSAISFWEGWGISTFLSPVLVVSYFIIFMLEELSMDFLIYFSPLDPYDFLELPDLMESSFLRPVDPLDYFFCSLLVSTFDFYFFSSSFLLDFKGWELSLFSDSIFLLSKGLDISVLPMRFTSFLFYYPFPEWSYVGLLSSFFACKCWLSFLVSSSLLFSIFFSIISSSFESFFTKGFF